MSAVVIIGNVSVICLVIAKPRLHTTANCFVVSLAVADFLVGAGYPVTEYLCDVHSCERLLVGHAVVSFVYAASVSNLCLMILDRYVAIVRPLRYVPLMTSTRVALLITLAWTVPFLPHFTVLVKSSILHDEMDVPRFMVFDFIVFELIPLTFLVIATGHIFLIARRHAHRSRILASQLRYNQTITGRLKLSPANRRQNSSAKLVGIAVAVFLLCYGYEIYYTVFYEISVAKERHKFLFPLNNLLFLLNSAVNPVAYAFFKGDIRGTLRTMLLCAYRHHKIQAAR